MHQSFPLLIWNERSFHAQRNTKISGVTKEHQTEIVSCSLFSTGPHASDVWRGAGWVWPEEIQHIRWGTQETAPCCEMLQKGTVSFWWRWINFLWVNNFLSSLLFLTICELVLIILCTFHYRTGPDRLIVLKALLCTSNVQYESCLKQMHKSWDRRVIFHFHRSTWLITWHRMTLEVCPLITVQSKVSHIEWLLVRTDMWITWNWSTNLVMSKWAIVSQWGLL